MPKASCARAAALLVVLAGLVLVPHTAAEAATLEKRCAEVTARNATVCAAYARRDDRHRARARVEGAVVVESVELQRYNCLTRRWQVVRRAETRPSTRAYSDGTFMVKWRARVHWTTRDGTARGTVTTPVHGFC